MMNGIIETGPPDGVKGPWTLVISLGVGIFFTLKCHFSKSGGFYSGGAAQQDGLYREKRPGRGRTGKGKESASSSRSAPRWPLLWAQAI